MNVLVISHTYISRINRDKWKVFAKKHNDIELKVIFPTKWPTHLFNHEAGDMACENTGNCTFCALGAFFVGNEVRYGYNTRSLMRLLKDFTPDIIHVEQGVNAFSYFQVILCAKLLRLKSRFSFFTWVNWRPKHSMKYRLLWRWIERFNIFFSHGAIAGNHDAKEILREKGLRSQIDVLPQLGVNTDIFQPAYVKKEKKYIGYVGRITSEKGVLHLAKAFMRLAEKFPDWCLLFVGTGPLEKQLIDFVITHKMLDRIEFRDPVTHESVSPILQMLDVLVLPSYDTPYWKEQFGHILIEAMACKVPIIASTGGEIPNVVGSAGLVFEQKNIEALTEQLKTLMGDQGLRQTLGQKGYDRVHTSYSHEIIAQKTYDFWKKL